MNNKVLMPMNPFLFLEILDLLINSISSRFLIRIFSGSAEGIKAFSNLNLDYLNKKLQDKILDSNDPFEFDKLKKDSKFDIFNNYTMYQKAKQREEDSPELILATSSSLRMGDSTLWMYLLNKNQKIEKTHYSVILTDPQFQSAHVTDPFFGDDIKEDEEDKFTVSAFA
jgi:hypothetical protein